jgi:hypothetical protein
MDFSARGPGADEGFLTEIFGERAVSTEEMREGSYLSGVFRE